MSLVLHMHPLSGFCHKVLIALYESGTPFEARTIDLFDTAQHARHYEMWPMGKIPVLRDEKRNCTVPETSIIIEYLEQFYPGPQPLLPHDATALLDARLWDRVFDLYVAIPMQKIVGDRLRADGEKDPRGVTEARTVLGMAYGMIDRQLATRRWAIGDTFTLPDCAAAPALFYAGIVEPFPASCPHLAAYFERLLERPSVRRTLGEARPWFQYFPYREAMPARFLQEDGVTVTGRESHGTKNA
ncbi:MAG TPA: glutathione S-transferase family protein [Povalibacter sp.]|uniref:glutathione S-transferase family protein n=1 Tax=Povalibacter sp. TaxID=1962978 RepID=UPI002C05E8A3|nr:glutathione S-transferase family protein [Povalibacter sp.]HMN44919.1 glutathione S-transferase family protein [Povalibacter sp.]